jgi:hypothetical protein
MKRRMLFCLLILTFSITINGQVNRQDAKSVLTSFLENSFNGRYFGWEGNRNDSLRLVASDYEDKIKSIDKSFFIVQGDNAFFVLSYSLDSIIYYSDYAIGYVSIVGIANGYGLELLKVQREKTNKKYLLLKEKGYWYVLAETKSWLISAKAYIKWGEEYLKDKTRTDGAERNNVIQNLKSFKEFYKVPCRIG